MTGFLRRALRLSDHDVQRLRVARRIVLGGVAFGIIAAGSLGLLGLDGRVGFGMFAVGCALGAVAAALVTVVLAIVDEARRQPVALGRMFVSLALFAAGAILLTMVAFLAGANA